MQSNGVRITDGVLKRRDDSLQYALAKALRRGLKKIPDELMPFAPLHLRITV
jgi:hypothetical protein